MTKSQQAAIEYLKGLLQDPDRKYGDMITEGGLTITETDYGPIWLAVTTEAANSEGTVLQYVSHAYYFFKIGKRGKIEAFQYPEKWDQFAGSTFVRNIHVKVKG